MPRETIYPERHGTREHPAPVVQVNWASDRYVNLGVHVAAETVSDGTHEQTQPPQPRELLLSDLPDEARTILDSLEREHGEVMGDALVELLLAYGDHVRAQGLFTTLDRRGCQRLVKVVRRARNQVFGADE
ncbi:MAG: hypothetical protein ACRDQD_12415 [Nocardioidaceae bacterium]